MSGKFEKKKAKKKFSKWWLILPVAALIVLLLRLLPSEPVHPQIADEAQDQTQAQTATNPTAAATEQKQTFQTSLKSDLEIVDIGGYTGIYIEDGSDELVTDVLMMKVVNNGEKPVEYAKFTMRTGSDTAEFTVSTLNPGATVVLLEKNRMPYDSTVAYSAAEVNCENLALFQTPLTLHEDKLAVQILDGAINVTNVSGQDITGRIAIYYKNKSAGIYYGGITYRIVLETGLKAGEIRQMTASHFSDTGSEIMFITIAQ